MAVPSRIQTLSFGSQTLSTGLFAVGKGGSLALEHLAFTSLPGDPATDVVRSGQVAFGLEELARASDLKVTTRYAVSGQSVFTRFVKLPAMGEGKVDQIVEFEAQQNVPFPISEVIWDYQLFNDSASGDTEVALIAIKADVLNQINEQIEEAGFVPETVDVAPMALLNAFRYNYPDMTGPCMLIDIGARTTNLVFSEQGRIFARSLPVGGATITSSIAKEFHVPFETAEAKKCADGFVALGGAYAEHSDPNLAAMARVARSSMTRLHAEIVRTINYYRSTLGGNQPRVAFLCGGGSALPYTKEFFEEKLALPVEYFNALRNVQVAPAVAEQAVANAFRIGEHVGLALRAVHACPVEIDLEPDSVALRREVREKKPLWIAAAVALIIGAASLFAYGTFAKDKAESKLKGAAAEAASLRALDSGIKRATSETTEIDKVRAPLLQAIAARQAWPELLNQLNKYFASDVVWVTDVEPLTGEVSVLPDMNKNAGSNARRPAPTAPTAAPAPDADPDSDEASKEPKQAANAINFIHIKGLWRGTPDNQNAGQDQVRKIFDTIRADQNSLFQTDKLDPAPGKSLRITGVDEETYAWPFEMTLPLKSPISLD